MSRDVDGTVKGSVGELWTSRTSILGEGMERELDRLRLGWGGCKGKEVL